VRNYHHLGIPTTQVRADERYLPDLKVHVSGYESSPCHIEWMRFDADCPVPDLVRWRRPGWPTIVRQWYSWRRPTPTSSRNAL
jgi:hypothetical protein